MRKIRVSRRVAALGAGVVILLGLFLLGPRLPGAAVQAEGAALGRTAAGQRLDRLVRVVSEGLDLNLTDQQRVAVRPIVATAAVGLHAINKNDSLTPDEKWEKASTVLQAVQEKVDSILNQDQREKLDAAIQRWTDLGVTPDQRQKLRSIAQSALKKVRSVAHDTSLNRDQRQAKMLTIRTYARVQAMKVLTPQQISKLQAMPKGEFLANVMAHEVGLSSDQKEHVQTILDNRFHRVQEALDDPGLSPGELESKIHAIRKDGRGRIADVLTPAQRQKLQTLLRQLGSEARGMRG